MIVSLPLPCTPLEYARTRLWHFEAKAERLRKAGFPRAAAAAQAEALRWTERAIELGARRERRRKKRAGPSGASLHTGRSEREIALADGPESRLSRPLVKLVKAEQ